MKPFGSVGGFQLTSIESSDITSALTATGASGTVNGKFVEVIEHCKILSDWI